MIVKIQKAGSSFKGLANYLTEEKDRVAWTHSLNCANDDVLSVVHEMVTTYSQAELLKEQAGVHAGGSVVETPVKHISLNWHPDEKPTREEMISTAESLLKEMGWDQHQALLVAHNDKSHSHVHIELNRIDPETGKALDDSFERRRASDWARDYELEHGKVYCEQRQLEPREQTQSPTRETWQQLREAEDKYKRDEIAEMERLEENYFRRGEREQEIPSREWELLKASQRAEREHFFLVEGKTAFKERRKEVAHDVREEYRDQWKCLYAVKRDGLINDSEFEYHRDKLAEEQRNTLNERITEAFAVLKEHRTDLYKLILTGQKEVRDELHDAQKAGRTSYDLLDRVYYEPQSSFERWIYDTANQNDKDKEVEAAAEPRVPAEIAEPEHDNANDNAARVKNGVDGIADIGVGLIGGLATIVERLFDSFLDGKPERAPKPQPAEPDQDTRTRREALRFQKIEEAIEQAQLERERQRDDAYLQDRQRSRG
jgi:hypothetical protein